MSHQPVLLTESIHLLAVKKDALYLDATFGLGGHSQVLLDQGARVIGLDYDQYAIDQGQVKFQSYIESGQLKLIKSNFCQLDTLADLPMQLAGVLFDFGTNSDQLTSAKRGLSFQDDGPLDMRLDDTLAVTASDLLNFVSVKELAQLLKDFGGEEEAVVLAKAIKASLPITTTQQLAQLVLKTKKRTTRLHPATKVFQALRIAVNAELDNIKIALPLVFQNLMVGGRIVCISFHEGEDRLVKNFLQNMALQNRVINLTKHPLTPTEYELSQNPRARSAKLRAAERLR